MQAAKGKRMLQGGPVWALGAMPGPALEGVQAAMVLTDGVTVFDFGPSAFRPHTAAEQATLRAAMGRWPGDAGVAEAAEVVETAHAEVLSRFDGAALIGFHGQTLAQDPGGRGTHQCGNGAVLAEVLGLPVVWDFRAADVRLGGRGAPLASFYLFALARHLGREPVAFLDMGAVGHLTWANPASTDPAAPGALLAFDTGPGHGLIADVMLARCDRPDPPGAAALPGQVDAGVLSRLLRQPHFARLPPKWLGPDFPVALAAAVGPLPEADARATLTACAAAAVAEGLRVLPAPPARLLVSGAGRHAPALMAELAARLPCPVAPVETAGLDGDRIDAQAMAHLAVRVARGLPTTGPGTTGVAAAVGGGEISRPG